MKSLAVWRIDPDSGGFLLRLRWLIDEVIGFFPETLVDGDLSGGVGFIGLTVVEPIARYQADAKMMMILFLPVEEGAANGFGILHAAEAPWDLRCLVPACDGVDAKKFCCLNSASG